MITRYELIYDYDSPWDDYKTYSLEESKDGKYIKVDDITSSIQYIRDYLDKMGIGNKNVENAINELSTLLE